MTAKSLHVKINAQSTTHTTITHTRHDTRVARISLRTVNMTRTYRRDGMVKSLEQLYIIEGIFVIISRSYIIIVREKNEERNR